MRELGNLPAAEPCDSSQISPLESCANTLTLAPPRTADSVYVSLLMFVAWWFCGRGVLATAFLRCRKRQSQAARSAVVASLPAISRVVEPRRAAVRPF